MCLSFCRKMYWTDGDNISMANMDGSNRTMLFTNQKGPVGEWVNTNTLVYNNAELVGKSENQCECVLECVSIVSPYHVMLFPRPVQSNESLKSLALFTVS
jgi:hypothetical protein